MAADPIALADMLLINDSNNADIEVSEVLNSSPFLAKMAAVESTNGDFHKYLRYLTAPAVGFRVANNGKEMKSSVDEQISITLQILDASSAIDAAIADGNPRGAEYIIRREALRHLQEAFYKTERQLFHGTSGGANGTDAGGFEGIDALAVSTDTKKKTLVYDVDPATSGSATAGSYTAVYLIRTAPEGAAIVLGNGMSIDIKPTVLQAMPSAIMTASSPLATGVLPAYYTPIHAYIGLQHGSTYDICKIFNIGLAGASAKKLDDDVLYKALALFPASRQPNHIVMNRNALEQLRDSRTATNQTGAPAPRPTEVDGIPITVVDSISSTMSWQDSTP